MRPRVEVVRGCACEATPPGRARRRPRARGRPRSRSSAARPEASLAGASAGASLAFAAVGLGARGVWRGGVGTAAGEPVRAVARGGGRRVVRRRARQPGRRLLAAVHGRPAGLRGVPGDRRARGARVSRRAGRRPARARGTRARLRRHALALGLLPALDLRPRRAGLHRLPGQPARPSRARPASSRRPTRAGLVLGLVWAPVLALLRARPRSPAPLPPPGGCAHRCCCPPPPTSRSWPPTTPTASRAASSRTTASTATCGSRKRPRSRCSRSASARRGCASGGRAPVSRGW